jgi:hypothetical protein
MRSRRRRGHTLPKEASMREWIVILALYGLVLFGFGWFGGMRAAGRSIEDWGRRSTRTGGTRPVS